MNHTLQILSVSQLNGYLSQLLQFDGLLGDLWLQGEISNFSQSSKGHAYFTIKDGAAQFPCVLFRSDYARVNARLENGQAVIIHGRVSLWEAAGRLQFYVDMVQPEGTGALELEFQALKAKLELEGLFDEDRKRPLPLYPSRIGIATSPQAAALQDILNVLGRRYPLAEILLSPTSVQGEGAGAQIANSIRRLYRDTRVDVIIVARGGGSKEDLWAFNEEAVARAIFASPVPVVSGVGHETDFTIADWVADLRAPTPSIAAEMVAPNVHDLHQQLVEKQRYINDCLTDQIQSLRNDLRHSESHLLTVSPRNALRYYRQRLDNLQQGVDTRLRYTLRIAGSRLGGQERRLQALNPKAVLRRGYAAVTTRKGMPVTGIDDISTGDRISVSFHDGGLVSAVEKVTRKEVESVRD